MIMKDIIETPMMVIAVAGWVAISVAETATTAISAIDEARPMTASTLNSALLYFF